MNPSTEAVTSIGVLGAGSWGTALAILLARNGLEVRLWGREDEIARLTEDRENRQYLPGIPFPDKLIPDATLSRVVDCDEILVAVPSQAFHEVLLKIAAIKPLQSLCWATKGLDPNTRRPLSFDAAAIFPGADLAVISGPTFAVEVAEGLPTAVTAASTSESYSERLAEAQNHIIDLLAYIEEREGFTLFQGEREKCTGSRKTRSRAPSKSRRRKA